MYVTSLPLRKLWKTDQPKNRQTNQQTGMRVKREVALIIFYPNGKNYESSMHVSRKIYISLFHCMDDHLYFYFLFYPNRSRKWDHTVHISLIYVSNYRFFSLYLSLFWLSLYGHFYLGNNGFKIIFGDIIARLRCSSKHYILRLDRCDW